MYQSKMFQNHVKYAMGAQNNHLIKMVILSTNNICSGLEIRKLIIISESDTEQQTSIIIEQWL